MIYNSTIHRRGTLRLQGYDYSSPGWYWITICTHQRCHLFGSVINKKMILNPAGKMVERIVGELPRYHPYIIVDKFVVMPNHFHCIIEICPVVSLKRANIDFAPTGQNGLGDVVQSFKRFTTITYIKMVKDKMVPSFDKRIWQRNYYERILRNEKELYARRIYIEQNSAEWNFDEYNK